MSETAHHTPLEITEIDEWFTALQTASTMKVDDTTLSAAQEDGENQWHVNENGETVRRDGGFFKLVWKKVFGGGREVPGWHQPMLTEEGKGIVILVRQEILGVTHHLVQALAELGNDTPGFVALAPTVQTSRTKFEKYPDRIPHSKYIDEEIVKNNEYIDTRNEETGVRIRAWNQIKDGGRFFKKTNRLIVIDLPPDTHASIEAGAKEFWATRSQIQHLLRRSLANEHLTETLAGC